MKEVLTTIDALIKNSILHNLNFQEMKLFRYQVFALLAGFAFLISSCQKESLQSNSQKQDLLNSSQKQDLKKECVPFKAKFVTVDEGQSDPTHEQYNGTGEGTHIGKSTFVSFVYFVNFPLITGTVTTSAANGDQIFSTFSGTVPDPDANGIVWITNEDIITGGTGRFAGATGSFIAHGNANAATLTFDGTICY